ncbi:MAG: outer membrane protein assembly factor [Proteobacteria bacterium]|nr:MAG: outer membrane protein assembly factor [Pseudomonadota bacterium]
MLTALTGVRGWSQSAQTVQPAKEAQSTSRSGVAQNAQEPAPLIEAGEASIAQWQGLPVRRISFEGVAPQRLSYLQGHLPQAEGKPLDRDDVAASLREVFSTGLFDSVEVTAQREGDGVALTFRGKGRMFIGNVTVDGAKGAMINTQLERASRLLPGTRFTEAKIAQALEQMRLAMIQNGFNESTISYALDPQPENQLTDISFRVIPGPQARVGAVAVNGDMGMSLDQFRRRTKLKQGTKVDRDTVNKALNGALKVYRKQDRLEAEIKLEAQSYTARKMDYRFTANKGPIVRVRVVGAPISGDRLKHLVPVFEEGTVDDDLLNEGNRHLRDYFQSQGYFDVKVDHNEQEIGPGEMAINYVVQLGVRRLVSSVSVDGNQYFGSDTLQELLTAHTAKTFDRHGTYSQAIVSADVSALEAVYQNNGFSHVKVTPETSLTGTPANDPPGQHGKPASLRLIYHIEEGQQQHVGSVKLKGNDHVEAEKLLPLLNTETGQLFSPRNLAGDRDALVTEYLTRGYDEAHVEVEEASEPGDTSKVDVVFHISEGRQIFVRNVLLTGLNYTRFDTVSRAITLHPGEPLNQSALLETQRNFYEFALFNEVNAVVQNPNGDEVYKTILLEAVEARRWTLTYGAGFEAQTGTPQNNCAGFVASGVPCSPNGRTGVSPRVLFNVTRNNLFGREQSASMQTTYGLLEQKVNLIYQNPHFRGNKNLGVAINGGYANSQAVTTYVASRLDGGMRWTHNYSKVGSGILRNNTFIYEFDYRRVKVAESSLQVYPDAVTIYATAVKVGGPAFTWLRDTRDSPIDAHRGTYSSFQEFISAPQFGAEVGFNRLDLSYSSYYGFSKNRFVLARNTRYGQERAFGGDGERLIPLPERLYSGGSTSMRGYSSNAAGPRDGETGFPIGGAGALINSTELRLPPPMLPYFGNTLSVVLFEDMGNVFTNAGDAWAAAARIRQPDRDVCKVLNEPPIPNPIPEGPLTSTGKQGLCRFDYFNHAAGLGLRYHTPVGPIRLDFSYNLNPPIFPVNIDYSLSVPDSQPHVGQASHFNFFFSLGQTF